jgi:hypothetical protein
VGCLTEIREKDFKSKEKEGNKTETSSLSMVTLNSSLTFQTQQIRGIGGKCPGNSEISHACIAFSFADFPSPDMERKDEKGSVRPIN